MSLLSHILEAVQPIVNTAFGAVGAVLLLGSVPAARLLLLKGGLPTGLASAVGGYVIAAIGMILYATSARPESAQTAVALAAVGFALFTFSMAVDEARFERHL